MTAEGEIGRRRELEFGLRSFDATVFSRPKTTPSTHLIAMTVLWGDIGEGGRGKMRKKEIRTWGEMRRNGVKRMDGWS
jgi:hypothetical protein